MYSSSPTALARVAVHRTGRALRRTLCAAWSASGHRKSSGTVSTRFRSGRATRQNHHRPPRRQEAGRCDKLEKNPFTVILPHFGSSRGPGGGGGGGRNLQAPTRFRQRSSLGDSSCESGGLRLHDSFRGTRDRFLVRWYSTWSFIRSSSTVREGETFADKPGCGSLIPIGLDWILFSNTHGKYRTEKRITEYGAG